MKEHSSFKRIVILAIPLLAVIYFLIFAPGTYNKERLCEEFKSLKEIKEVFHVHYQGPECAFVVNDIANRQLRLLLLSGNMMHFGTVDNPEYSGKTIIASEDDIDYLCYLLDHFTSTKYAHRTLNALRGSIKDRVSEKLDIGDEARYEELYLAPTEGYEQIVNHKIPDKETN